jgi:hypothetical protein
VLGGKAAADVANAIADGAGLGAAPGVAAGSKAGVLAGCGGMCQVVSGCTAGDSVHWRLCRHGRKDGWAA